MRSRGGVAHSLPIGGGGWITKFAFGLGSARDSRAGDSESFRESRTFLFPLSPLQFAAGRIRRGGRFNESRGDSVIIVRQVWD